MDTQVFIHTYILHTSLLCCPHFFIRLHLYISMLLYTNGESDLLNITSLFNSSDMFFMWCNDCLTCQMVNDVIMAWNVLKSPFIVLCVLDVLLMDMEECSDILMGCKSTDPGLSTNAWSWSIWLCVISGCSPGPGATGYLYSKALPRGEPPGQGPIPRREPTACSPLPALQPVPWQPSAQRPAGQSGEWVGEWVTGPPLCPSATVNKVNGPHTTHTARLKELLMNYGYSDRRYRLNATLFKTGFFFSLMWPLCGLTNELSGDKVLTSYIHTHSHTRIPLCAPGAGTERKQNTIYRDVCDWWQFVPVSHQLDGSRVSSGVAADAKSVFSISAQINIRMQYLIDYKLFVVCCVDSHYTQYVS